MHLHHRPFRPSRGYSVTTLGAIVVFVVAPVWAQPEFWQPTTGPGGGSVAHLVAQPDGDLYAAMYSGPIYRSAGGGGIWHPLTRSATRLATLPNGDLHAFSNGGLYRSRDDGVTWVHLDTAPSYARTVVAMPSGALLLGASSGVWRSLNDGVAWEPTALASEITSDLVVEGTIVYAGSRSSLLRSDNEGQSWTPVTAITNQTISALARRTAGGWWIGTTRGGFPPSPSGTLYRFVDGQEPESLPVWAENVTDILVRPDGSVFVASSGDYFSESSGSVFSSLNDGETWSSSLVTTAMALVLRGQDGIYATSASSYGHVGTIPGLGILRTSGPGTQWSPHNAGLVHATSLALSTTPGTLCAQAGYSVAISHDHGVSWELGSGTFFDTFGLQLAVHPSGDVFSASVPWVASSKRGRSTAGNPLVNRSRDGGATWTSLDVDSDISASIRVTAAGSVLIPSYLGVARSTDRGDTWQNESMGLGAYQIASIRPGPISRVFASTWGEFTYVSEDDGVSWRQIGSVGGHYLGVSPQENRVFVRGSGPIYQLDETPGPGDWSTQELPALQSYGPMAVDEAGTVYVASDAVWFKRLTDSEWQAIPGTPELGSSSSQYTQWILIDDAGFLFVGTSDHSVLRSRVPVGRADPTDSGHESTISVWQPGPTPFRRQTAFALELGTSGPVSLVLYDVRGRVVSTLWEGNRLGPGLNVATWRPGTAVASGTYYYRLVASGSTRTGRVTLVR